MSLKEICLKKIELERSSSIYRNMDLGCPAWMISVRCGKVAVWAGDRRQLWSILGDSLSHPGEGPALLGCIQGAQTLEGD